MLGPIFAALLILSPASAPAQSCWLLCSDSGSSRGPTVGERFQQQQWEDRVTRLEQQERSRQLEQWINPPSSSPPTRISPGGCTFNIC